MEVSKLPAIRDVYLSGCGDNFGDVDEYETRAETILSRFVVGLSDKLNIVS